MTEQGIKIVDVFQKSYIASRDRFQRDTGVNPEEKDISPRKCAIGWGMLFLILNMEDCPLKFNVINHHTAFQAKLEVSNDCPYYGVYFIYE